MMTNKKTKKKMKKKTKSEDFRPSGWKPGILCIIWRG